MPSLSCAVPGDTAHVRCERMRRISSGPSHLSQTHKSASSWMSHQRQSRSEEPGWRCLVLTASGLERIPLCPVLMIFELQFDSQNAAGLARNHRAKLRGISDESLLRANQVCNILLLITVNAAGARTRRCVRRIKSAFALPSTKQFLKPCSDSPGDPFW